MVQEITNRSWGSRIIDAFKGIIIGLLLLIGGFVLVFWNEGHSLHTKEALQQAQHVLYSAPNHPIDANNNHHVIYINGLATTQDTLHDTTLGVSENALQLIRHVEMYQWKENVKSHTDDNLGGSEQEVNEYTYTQTWSDEPINSIEFKEPNGHHNPSDMPLHNHKQYAQPIHVGDFNLPKDLVSQLQGETAVDLHSVNLTRLQSILKKPTQLSDDTLYVGNDPQSPKVGDLKISLFVILPQPVSIIAEQTENTFQPYVATSGKSVNLLAMGIVSPTKMIFDAQTENKEITWVLRFVSLLMLIIGIALLMQPLVVLADFIPFFGSLLGFGTGLIAFVVGLLLWSIALGIAWFAVRPLLAIGMVVGALVIGALTMAFRRYATNSFLKK